MDESVSSFVIKALAPRDEALLTHIDSIGKATLGSISGALDRLHDLAKAIRRASTKDLVRRVESYRDRVGKDDNDSFELYALQEIRRHLPSVSDSLASQLAMSITFRRLRLRYQQRHHRKLSQRRHRSSIPVSPQEVENALVSANEGTPPRPAHSPQPPELTRLSDALSMTEPSILNANQLQQNLSVMESNRSSASGPSIRSIVGGKYKYPKQPQPLPGSKSCSCNWCFEELESSKLEIGGWWRSVYSSCSDFSAGTHLTQIAF